MTDPYALMAAIGRELPEGWRAERTPQSPGRRLGSAGARDGDAIHAAHERVKIRRRAELIRYYRDQLTALGEAA
jgi:hypothetical protein